MFLVLCFHLDIDSFLNTFLLLRLLALNESIPNQSLLTCLIKIDPVRNWRGFIIIIYHRNRIGVSIDSMKMHRLKNPNQTEGK